MLTDNTSMTRRNYHWSHVSGECLGKEGKWLAAVHGLLVIIPTASIHGSQTNDYSGGGPIL